MNGTIVFVVVALGCLVYWLARPRAAPSAIPAAEPQTRPSSTAVEDLAPWAYEQAIAEAQEKAGVVLDGSDGSIQQVELLLGSLAETGVAEDGGLQSGVQGTAMIYGFYIGECIRRLHGGTWAEDHPVAGPRSYPMSHRGSESFPTAWAVKRVLNGAEDNVWHKYQIFVLP
jgi:hypothetical protein